MNNSLPTLLTAFALFTDPAEPSPWSADRADVRADDDDLEILAFDANGDLAGTLLLTLPPTPDDGPIMIEANFPDGYATAPLLIGELDGPPTIETDLTLAEAERRIEALLAFIPDAGLDVGRLGEPLTRKQCVVMFGTATVVCAGAALTGNIGIALGCFGTTQSAICSCAKYIPIKLCDG